jgi:hypothetical protein
MHRRRARHRVAPQPRVGADVGIHPMSSASSVRITGSGLEACGGAVTRINDLIDLILGPQFATNTTMPRLPTRPTVGPLASQKLLRLRARLRAALRPRLRRIRRRRPRTRPRVLTRRNLKPRQPLLQLRHTSSELENELNTHLPPRVKIASASARSMPARFAAPNRNPAPRPRRLNATHFCWPREDTKGRRETI